jgi:hypothetical protein
MQSVPLVSHSHSMLLAQDDDVSERPSPKGEGEQTYRGYTL